MNRIPQFIQKNIQNINKCLEINIGGRRGSTGYIDYLQKEDFINNHNIIYGYDNASRFFISLLYRKISLDNINKKYEDHNIMTLFQRYTNEPSFFVSCGDTFIHKSDVQTYNFSNTDNPMPTQFDHFFNLINNKQISITYNINDVYNLYDEYFDRKKTNYYELYNRMPN